MLMDKQSIGSVVFYRNPNTMNPPDSKKTVAVVDTYSGSAVFQWEDILQGTNVTLGWDWMSKSEYELLRDMYLTTDTYNWVSRYNSQIYTVLLTNINGRLIEDGLDNVAYRKEVTLELNIRSLV